METGWFVHRKDLAVVVEVGEGSHPLTVAQKQGGAPRVASPLVNCLVSSHPMAPCDPLAQLNALIKKGRPSPLRFQRAVLSYFKSYGRSFPWRETSDPYRILVSEVMLQQTQTERVVERYRTFLKAFPTVKKLAAASQGDVVREWMGLGYYRRAKNLHRAAQVICGEFGGRVPGSVEELRLLPGIGAYTAAAIAAFAFGVSAPMIETNIRSVFIHTFFTGHESVRDAEILELVEATLYKKDPRAWFYALMDLGVELKRSRQVANHRSAHYKKQSRFIGSTRQVRAAVLREISREGARKASDLEKSLGFNAEKIRAALSALEAEGFISRVRGGRYQMRSA